MPSSTRRKKARQFAKEFLKSKSKILMFTRLSAEKGSADDYHIIEKKSKRTEEMELA